jgi:hypothetical protein
MEPRLTGGLVVSGADRNLPTVGSCTVSDITPTTVTIDATVEGDGEAAVNERGVCWGKNPNPATTGTHMASGYGLGPFSVQLSGLAPVTPYHVRAYAINAFGTAYGADGLFQTAEINAGGEPE